MSSLSMVIPDLFGTFPASAVREADRPAPCLMQTLLSRADTKAFAGTQLDEVLFQLFGGRRGAGGDIPAGAISRVADLGGEADGWWMRADPVHLKPDRDRLLLFDSQGLELQPSEAEQLAALFNDYYRERGWRIEVGHPERWYLRLPADPEVRTHPLSEVVGRDLEAFLPASAGAAELRFVLNEVQMLFHGAEVNRRREARGLPPVNSLWFWGAGPLPEALSTTFSGVYADTPFARGLAAVAGIQAWSLPANLDGLLGEPLHGELLLVDAGLRRHVMNADYGGWKGAVTSLDRDFMTPVYRALKSGRLGAIRIFPCNGSSYRVERRCLRRFWRRRTPLLA